MNCENKEIKTISINVVATFDPPAISYTLFLEKRKEMDIYKKAVKRFLVGYNEDERYLKWRDAQFQVRIIDEYIETVKLLIKTSSCKGKTDKSDEQNMETEMKLEINSEDSQQLKKKSSR